MRRESGMDQRRVWLVGGSIVAVVVLFVVIHRSSMQYKTGAPDHWAATTGWKHGYETEPKEVRAAKTVKKILITGGAGFVGSHLADRLLALGHEVIALDNISSGRISNVAHLLEHPRFTLVEHDVIVPYFVDCDQIYHLASPASPPFYQKDPLQTFRTNVWGTYNMLMLANMTNARFFLASTSEVYGDPTEHPQKESYFGNVNTIGKRACYDEGKRSAETLTFDFHRENKVDIRVVRIFNTYGPRMDINDGRVVSNFIVATLRGEPVSLYGTGEQTRSFQFVSDLVSGFLKVMDGPFLGTPVNLGNPGEYTMRELAAEIASTLGVELQATHKPKPDDDPQRRKPDITLAREQLGWEPVVSLRKGLEPTIAYFREEINAAAGGRGGMV